MIEGYPDFRKSHEIHVRRRTTHIPLIYLGPFTIQLLSFDTPTVKLVPVGMCVFPLLDNGFLGCLILGGMGLLGIIFMWTERLKWKLWPGDFLSSLGNRSTDPNVSMLQHRIWPFKRIFLGFHHTSSLQLGEFHDKFHYKKPSRGFFSHHRGVKFTPTVK